MKIGDFFVVEPNVVRLAGRRIAGRPLDDRIGCVALIEIAKRLNETRDDVYFVFTAQEEVGLRGAKTSTFVIAPDYAIAFDVTGSGDMIGAKSCAVKVGGGAAIKIKDASVICNPDLVASLEQTAKDNKISYQFDVAAAGGTDTAAMQAAGFGCAAAAISIPTRYIHSAVETVDLGDVEACIALTVAWLSR